jgi:trans-2,3-dihydro-3-hydroxyanthranilate isomerase
MSSYRYLHLDVFTDRVFTGNQLAVFPDATGLGTDVMQRIATEMAFSETTFVLPVAMSGADFPVRIFTPRRELPMAGHPVVGTTFALAHEGRIALDRAAVVFGLGVGPTPIGLEWESGRLRFAWMTQSVPEFGELPTDIDGLAVALSVEGRDIRDSNLPPQVVSSGVPFLFVPLASRKAVDSIVVDRATLRRFSDRARIPELPVFVFSLERADDDVTVYSRMFAPMFGIPEDPATGGASGPLGGYLVRHRAVTSERASHMVSLQGAHMGRPSRIHIAVNSRNGTIGAVRVGGESVLVGEGTIRVPA